MVDRFNITHIIALESKVWRGEQQYSQTSPERTPVLCALHYRTARYTALFRTYSRDYIVHLGST